MSFQERMKKKFSFSQIISFLEVLKAIMFPSTPEAHSTFIL